MVAQTKFVCGKPEKEKNSSGIRKKIWQVLATQKLNMNGLPADIWFIILDYKTGAEHYDRFRPCLRQIHKHFMFRQHRRLNLQFNNIFFPNFYSTLFFETVL